LCEANETALLELPPQQFKLVMDSVVWAFKHTMRDIADTGLSSNSFTAGDELLLTCLVAFEIVNNFASSTPEIANQFYQQYLLSMLGDVFYVLTDADHKSGKSPEHG
jgi:exportin-1